MIDAQYRNPHALRVAPRRVLEEAIRTGTAPAFDSLSGWVFRGWNTLWLTRVLGFQKFAKGFYTGPERAEGPSPFVQGYNLPVVQNANWDPHVPKPSREAAKPFGFYRVYAAPSRYPNALLLDYGKGKNGLNLAGFLRDYLVQVWPDVDDLYLGKAYVALGVWIPVSYFVLERGWRSESP